MKLPKIPDIPRSGTAKDLEHLANDSKVEPTIRFLAAAILIQDDGLLTLQKQVKRLLK